MTLLSGQTFQDIQFFTLDFLEMSNKKCTFKVHDKVKQTPGACPPPPENFENLGTFTCNLVQSGK